MGLTLTKILNAARKEKSPQTSYQKRVNRLGEISESMTEYNKSKIEINNEISSLPQSPNNP